LSKQPGGRQHVIPASHIGEFSNVDINPKRNRPIWFRRDGMKGAVELKAENVGIHKHIYTLHGDNLEERYVDRTWKYVEDNLQLGLRALAEHKNNIFFDGTVWSTILVPFVAQLFIRGVDYSKLLLARAPYLEKLDGHFGPHATDDNTNLNRLIDYQVNCGLLCDAEWRLLHNESEIPFILGDLGYATFNAQRYGAAKGYLIPISKKLLIIVTKRNPSQRYVQLYGSKIIMLQSPFRENHMAKSFNERIARCADSEIYGPTEGVVNQSWGKRDIRKKESSVGPAYIQHRHLRDADKLDIHWQYLDKFKVNSDIRKEVYGGRVIEVVEETLGRSVYVLKYKEL